MSVEATSVAAGRPRTDEVWVVYDGQCPLCSRYVLMYRLRQNVGRVHLVDARSDHPIVGEIRALGLDLNEGMAVRWNGRLYYGADAMHLLGMLGTEGTFFNKLNRALFARQRLAHAVYPSLVRGRKMLLRLLGRQPIQGS